MRPPLRGGRDGRAGAGAGLTAAPDGRGPPDGSLWVTLYAKGRLIRVDPVAGKVLKECPLPAGPGGGPYAVTVDVAGTLWANEFSADTVVRLDPKTE